MMNVLKVEEVMVLVKLADFIYIKVTLKDQMIA